MFLLEQYWYCCIFSTCKSNPWLLTLLATFFSSGFSHAFVGFSWQSRVESLFPCCCMHPPRFLLRYIIHTR